MAPEGPAPQSSHPLGWEVLSMPSFITSSLWTIGGALLGWASMRFSVGTPRYANHW